MRRLSFGPTILVAVASAALLIACEKSNEAVIQEQFRESNNTCKNGCEEFVAGCTIKGNISVNGEKFYHVAGTQNYEGIVVQPEKGERWFCTELEAQRSGFVRKDN